MRRVPSPGATQWATRRSLRAAAVAVALALVPAACDNSDGKAKEETVDATSLARAAASLALSVGELVERYAAELPTGDDRQEDMLRLERFLTDGADPLGLEAVGSSFTAAAMASRQAGNSRPQTARQLTGAARLASAAFVPPQADYRPGDGGMLVALASSLEPQLNAALATADYVEADRFTGPDTVPEILADRTALAVMVAGYNYTGQDGSRPIRDRMRALGMQDPPGEFLDPGGNLRLPQEGDARELVGRFETWQRFRNPLFDLGIPTGLSRVALKTLFRPAVEKAFE